MLRRIFHRPLYIYFGYRTWTFLSPSFRLRHSIKILMAKSQLNRYDKEFHPGYYEVKWKLVSHRPMLMFIPLQPE